MTHGKASAYAPPKHDAAIVQQGARGQAGIGKESRGLMTQQRQENSGTPGGSRDGDGAGDHDEPYRFGGRPRASLPCPFNTRQYARLLVLRGRVREDIDRRAGFDLVQAVDADLDRAA